MGGIVCLLRGRTGVIWTRSIAGFERSFHSMVVDLSNLPPSAFNPRRDVNRTASFCGRLGAGFEFLDITPDFFCFSAMRPTDGECVFAH
jgi:hypothetical protein